jgi:tripartite-type tricarboxylate transporter receptor subunit TctC
VSYYLFVVHPDIEATTLGEFIAMAKERPGELNYASAGIGTATFMNAEFFKARAGVDIQRIPYEGGGPALASVVAGETDFYGAPYSTAKPFIEDGSVRALAVSGAERLPMMPEVPAASEFVEDFEFTSWYGLVLPKGTPTEIRDKLRSAMTETLADPDVKRRLEDLGLDVIDQGPDEFAAFLEREVAILKEVVAMAGIEPQ